MRFCMVIMMVIIVCMQHFTRAEPLDDTMHGITPATWKQRIRAVSKRVQQLRSTPDILIILHFQEIHSFLASTRRGIVQQQIEDEIDFPVDHLDLEPYIIGPPANINANTTGGAGTGVLLIQVQVQIQMQMNLLRPRLHLHLRINYLVLWNIQDRHLIVDITMLQSETRKIIAFTIVIIRKLKMLRII